MNGMQMDISHTEENLMLRETLELKVMKLEATIIEHLSQEVIAGKSAEGKWVSASTEENRERGSEEERKCCRIVEQLRILDQGKLEKSRADTPTDRGSSRCRCTRQWPDLRCIVMVVIGPPIVRKSRRRISLITDVTELSVPTSLVGSLSKDPRRRSGRQLGMERDHQHQCSEPTHVGEAFTRFYLLNDFLKSDRLQSLDIHPKGILQAINIHRNYTPW
eukprot:Gb_26637 [translate_table: standard]